MSDAVGARTWLAPAKINLMLQVCNRRADGYHNLHTVFQLLDIGDAITLEINQNGTLASAPFDDAIAPEHDMSLRAAQLLQRASGTDLGVQIRTEKRLPIGSGLGGGSSNAATVLCALNHMWRTNLSRSALLGLARKLGADVPVFVAGNCAWATGVGDQLVPIRLPRRYFFILYPGVRVATAAVFARCEPACEAPITLQQFMSEYLDKQIYNSLQSQVAQMHPQVAQALSWLATQAAGAPVGLSGTGSCVFALCEDLAKAQQLHAQLPAPWRGWVTSGVQKSPLHRALDA